MNKRTTSYWATTGLLALILTGSGLAAVTQQESLVVIMKHLGFPLYVMFIIGTSYVIASIALLVPGLPLIKEWAYAGVGIAMTSALACHVFSGDPFGDFVMPVVIISLAVGSHVLRPPSRRLVRATA